MSMSREETLAENRYARKRRAGTPSVGHAKPMRRKPKSHLQALFLKRLDEELSARELTVNAFTKRAGAPGQSTMNPIFNATTDPRLGTVDKIANALGIPAWHLFIERSDIPSHRRGTISKFPEAPGIGRQHSVLTGSDKSKKQA